MSISTPPRRIVVVPFEDEAWERFLPLVYTRPLYGLRCGAFTCVGRINGVLKQQGIVHTIMGLCRSILMPVYGPENGSAAPLREQAPLLFVNGRALDLDWLPELLSAPLDTIYLHPDGSLLGAYLSPEMASAVLYYLREQQVNEAARELQRFCTSHERASRMIVNLWDVMSYCGEQLVRDAALLRARLIPATADSLPPGIITYNTSQVLIAPNARLDGHIVLDARDGPIMIDEEAQIEPFSFIQGPAYIGRKTLISSARIRPESSFGPVCRIGGEVEASTIQGYSNKHHDGFLGHSWLGEWVNLGAMTTTSDLKNTYGTIRILPDGRTSVDTGSIKIGSFIADHAKLGIGMHLNAGTLIGPGSNLFGISFAPKTIPAFVWGGDILREYAIQRMIEVSRKVMLRRKQEMTPAYASLLYNVFSETRSSRSAMTYAPDIRLLDRSPDERKLAAAEQLAIQ